MNRIERNRRKLDSSPARRWFSPAVLGLERELDRALGDHVGARLLDVGCGAMPYRKRVHQLGASYDGLDVESRAPGVRFTCSATHMTPVPSSSYDTVLCSEVFEHLDQPAAAAAEIARVLQPGGKAILSVPFLGRLHEEPHDYFRYTEHGLRSLLGAAGLETVELRRTGSVGSFLGHQLATATVATVWHVPLLKWLVLGLNGAFVVAPARGIDRALGGLAAKLPLGYVVVAAKP